MRCSPGRGSSRAGPRRGGRSRRPGSRPTGSPSPRRPRRSPTCCSPRASPAGGSRCSTTAPGADGLDKELAAAGAEVRSLVVYRWGPPPDPAALAARSGAAAAARSTRSSSRRPRAPHAWLAAADAEGVTRPVVRRLRVGAHGRRRRRPGDGAAAERRGITPLVPDRGRLGALVRMLVGHYGRPGRRRHDGRGRLQVRRTVALLDDHVLPLSPSGLEVLRLLAEAGGDVVTRGQVLTVLPGDSTDPHAAEVAVARLREACGGRALIRPSSSAATGSPSPDRGAPAAPVRPALPRGRATAGRGPAGPAARLPARAPGDRPMQRRLRRPAPGPPPAGDPAADGQGRRLACWCTATAGRTSR